MPRRPSVTRQRERLPVTLRVRFRPESGRADLSFDLIEAVAADLHEEGLFLRSPIAARLPVGTQVEIELCEGSLGRVAAGGEVAHRRPDGCGVRFVRVDVQSQKWVRALVEACRRHLWAQHLSETQRALSRK